MARMSCFGLDELMKDIATEANNMPEVAAEMLEEGGKVLADEVRRQMDVYGVRDTGTTAESIKVSEVKEQDGIKFVEISPRGRRKDSNHPKGERNATVAFVNEYGTSNTPARPFMAAAVKSAERPVAEAMLRVWERSGKR